MSSVKVIVGKNDISTIRPDIASLLKNKSDGHKYIPGSASYTWFVCPVCNENVYRQIADMSKRGFVCPKCKYGSKNHLSILALLVRMNFYLKCTSTI